MFKLNNEIQIPEIGLGVYKMEVGKEMNDAVKYAYQSGYRLYDTAQMYKNEQSLGDALKENKIPREDIFLISFCKENDIQIMAWGPLLRGNLENKKIEQIAEKYKKTTAQLLLRWNIEQEIIPIPKSKNKQRLQQNMDVFDFEIMKEDMEELNRMNENHRTSFDPLTFDF